MPRLTSEHASARDLTTSVLLPMRKRLRRFPLLQSMTDLLDLRIASVSVEAQVTKKGNLQQI
jgi:hypothetical protein